MTPGELQRRIEDFKEAIASVRLERMEPTQQSQDIIMKAVRGELSWEEMRKELIDQLFSNNDSFLALEQIEGALVAARSIELLAGAILPASFNSLFLQEINHYLFQDLP